jgi:hypothetical protein
MLQERRKPKLIGQLEENFSYWFFLLKKVLVFQKASWMICYNQELNKHKLFLRMSRLLYKHRQQAPRQYLAGIKALLRYQALRFRHIE